MRDLRSSNLASWKIHELNGGWTTVEHHRTKSRVFSVAMFDDTGGYDPNWMIDEYRGSIHGATGYAFIAGWLISWNKQSRNGKKNAGVPIVLGETSIFWGGIILIHMSSFQNEVKAHILKRAPAYDRMEQWQWYMRTEILWMYLEI